MDKSAAAFGLEPRFPFFDRRLVELCLALPAGQKLHGGWTRAVLRQAMVDVLPPQIRQRTSKAHLGPNFSRSFAGCDRNIVESMIVENAALIEDYVDIPVLHAAYNRYIHHPMDKWSALTVYSATNLALWLRQVQQPTTTGMETEHTSHACQLAPITVQPLDDGV